MGTSGNGCRTGMTRTITAKARRRIHRGLPSVLSIASPRLDGRADDESFVEAPGTTTQAAAAGGHFVRACGTTSSGFGARPILRADVTSAQTEAIRRRSFADYPLRPTCRAVGVSALARSITPSLAVSPITELRHTNRAWDLLRRFSSAGGTTYGGFPWWTRNPRHRPGNVRRRRRDPGPLGP